MNNKIKGLMVGSIALNILMSGVIIGQVMQPHPRHHPHHRAYSGMSEAIEKLPEDKQDYVRELMKKLREQGKENRKAIRASREETLRILTAETFNSEAYNKEVEHIHELRGNQMQLLANTIRDAAQNLEPKDRQILAEFLRRPPPPRD